MPYVIRQAGVISALSAHPTMPDFPDELLPDDAPDVVAYLTARDAPPPPPDAEILMALLVDKGVITLEEWAEKRAAVSP